MQIFISPPPVVGVCMCMSLLLLLLLLLLCYVCMYVQTCPPEAWLLINDTNLSHIWQACFPRCLLTAGRVYHWGGRRPGTGSYTYIYIHTDTCWWFPCISNYPHNQCVSFLLDVYPVIWSTFSGYLCVASTINSNETTPSASKLMRSWLVTGLRDCSMAKTYTWVVSQMLVLESGFFMTANQGKFILNQFKSG